MEDLTPYQKQVLSLIGGTSAEFIVTSPISYYSGPAHMEFDFENSEGKFTATISITERDED